jgi:hypothetical protein
MVCVEYSCNSPPTGRALNSDYQETFLKLFDNDSSVLN